MTAITDRLHHIEETEVLCYYDGPMSFFGIDETGCLYYFHATRGDDYFAVPVTPERAAAIRSGNVDLRTAILAPEGGVLYVVNYACHGGDVPVVVRQILPGEADLLAVPVAGVTLFR